MNDTLKCLDHDDECSGKVELRYPLSPSGRSFPRCEFHWDKRLDLQDEIESKYPVNEPVDFDPMYAGERWSED